MKVNRKSLAKVLGKKLPDVTEGIIDGFIDCLNKAENPRSFINRIGNLKPRGRADLSIYAVGFLRGARWGQTHSGPTLEDITVQNRCDICRK